MICCCRINDVTSLPLTKTLHAVAVGSNVKFNDGNKASTASWSLTSILLSRTAHVTPRYMAPVSIYKYPNSLATTLEILLLPAPAGPSIAMAIFLVLIITSILHHRVRHA